MYQVAFETLFFMTVLPLIFVEYIVSFTGYYSTHERGSLIKDALVNISTSLKELERDNPASRFPSDFSLVEVYFH